MIEVVFFPLALVISICTLLLVCFGVGCRHGQGRSRFAIIGAGICTIVFLIGTTTVWQPWIRQSAYSPVDRLAEMSNQELLELWQDGSSAGSFSQTNISREVQVRLETHAFQARDRKSIVERAIQLVIDDPNGAGLSWLWQVRHWAISDLLSQTQTDAVLTRLAEEDFYAVLTKLQSGIRVNIQNQSDSTSHGIFGLGLPDESIRNEIEVIGLESDGVLYSDARPSGNSGSTTTSSRFRYSLNKRGGFIKMPARIQESDWATSLLRKGARTEAHLRLTIEKSDAAGHTTKVISTVKLEAKIDDILSHRESILKPDIGPIETTEDPLAALLLEAVIRPDIQVTAQANEQGYTLTLAFSPIRQIQRTPILLPFNVSMSMEVLEPLCDSGSWRSSIRLPSNDLLTTLPLKKPASLTSIRYGGNRLTLDCTGEIPACVDVQLKYQPLSSRGFRFRDPHLVFYGGDLIFEDVPVLIKEPEDAAP